MATEGGGKEMNEIKTQFTTREGLYKLLPHSQYSRPNRVPFNSQGSNPVRVSFVNLNDQSGNGDRLCFNVGRELYFYIYKGVRKERLIDKSRVTCVKWVPGSESLFLVAHSSGNMYSYNVEHTCGTTAPHYQLLKQGESFAVHTCKSKSTRNPLLKWTVGEGALNEFAFSPDGKFLACVSQDGFLRVFSFDSVELRGTMKSYFGGLLCVCWSPDGKYIVTGGEDDLVTVWSFVDCQVIARGHGHKSWVSVAAFDPYTTSVEESDPMEFSGSDEDFQDLLHFGKDRANSTQSRLSKGNSTDSRPVSVTYRFGSVGQDTQLCLWDLTEDILFPHQPLSRARTHTNVMNATSPPAGSNGNSVTTLGNSVPPLLPRPNSLPHSAVSNAGSKSSVMDGAIASGVSKFATLSLHDRERHHEKNHKRNHSMGHISSKSSDKLNLVTKTKTDPAKTLGTPLCPRMEDVPLLEPLTCEKIAHERLYSHCLSGGIYLHMGKAW
ncbi:WD repeat-containing protein 20 isoform X3 [Aotus nancymaae]|uniref:WD repeat-containing protein 20 isoform X3 n=1 Tax=Aotus nancymaae TaxID=37293 RepID=UPI0030FEF5CE